MRARGALNILVRVLIFGSVALIFLEFSDLMWLELHHLDRPFNIFTLTAGIFGPILAIAAAMLAVVNKHLIFAAICVVASFAIFVTPLIVFILTFAK